VSTHIETTVSTKNDEVISAIAKAGGRHVELAIRDREGGCSPLFELTPDRARLLASGLGQAADVAELKRDQAGVIQLDGEGENVIPAGAVR